jgi:hypothetical protein
MTLYRNILSQAWSATWRNKYLWFFGLFALFISNTGEIDYVFQVLGSDKGNSWINFYQQFAATGIFHLQAFFNLIHLFKVDPLGTAIILLVFLFVLALFLAVVWLAIVSQIAIVNNSAVIFSSKKGEPLKLKDGIIAGAKKFWQVLLLNLSARVLIVLAILFVSEPISKKLLNFNSLLGTLISFLFVIVFLIIVLSFSFVVKYAITYIVVRKEKIVPAVKKAWVLFRENWLVSIEMAVVLFLVNFLAAVIILVGIFALLIPFYALAFALGTIFSPAWYALVIIIALIVSTVIAAVGGAMVTAFSISSWTGLFVRLVGRGGESKILRMIDDIKK